MDKIIKEIQIGWEDSQYNECKPSELEYLGEDIFDFTCYDSDISKLFAQGMIEVIEALILKKTFEYQNQSDSKYLTYLTMVNMPFLHGKLNWGTSIRGVWIEDELFEIKCKAILEWVKLNPPKITWKKK